MDNLREILEQNRRRLFVGRNGELAAAERLLMPDSEECVLFFSAPGGLGKSTLLTEIEARAKESGSAVARIDARHCQPIPADIAKTINGAVSDCGECTGPILLIIDTFEHLKVIEQWFFMDFIPTLDAPVRLIIAGRRPPGARWRTDPAWTGLMRTLELSPFDREEGRDYLVQRGLKECDFGKVWCISEGNPLLLALSADLCERLGTEAFDERAGRDHFHSSILELAREAQTPAQERAFQAASIVRLLSKPLLAAMLPEDDAAALYEWLSGLSFFSAVDGKVFPHDLMREAVCADLAKHQPEWQQSLIQRAERFYAENLMPSDASSHHRTLLDAFYLSRHEPANRQFLDLLAADPCYPDVPTSRDVLEASALVRRHQGEAQQRLFDYWNRCQPQGLIAIRDSNQDLTGFVQLIEFSSLDEEETRCDSVIHACRRYIRDRGLAPGRQAILGRFWLDRQRHLEHSAVEAMTMLQALGHAAADSRIDYCGYVHTDTEVSRIITENSGRRIVPGTELVVNGVQIIATLHDFSGQSVPEWLLRTGRRIRGVRPSQPAMPEPNEFKAAVKHALRNFIRPDRLSGNLLIDLVTHDREPTESDAEALQRTMMAAANTLQTTPKTARYYDVLLHSYLQPAATQMAAAEALDMAASTYYRHLATAKSLLAEALYKKLIDGRRFR